MKFKVGDKVKLSKKIIKWYLTDDGQDCFFSSSGKQDTSQSKTHDECTVIMLSLCMKNDVYGEIVAHNWAFSEMENFRVNILDYQINVLPKNLILIERD